MTVSPQTDLNTCCATAYSHPAVRYLLGDSLHPGGLTLTEEVASQFGLSSESRVLDVGCGPGATSLFLAKKYGASVTGVTLEESSAEELESRANDQGLDGKIEVITGDISNVDVGTVIFDAAIAECVISIFDDKPAVIQRVFDAIKPGGRIGISDVIVDGELPPHLQNVFVVAGCVGAAWSLDQYVSLVETAGFHIVQSERRTDVATSFVESIGKMLMFAEIGVKLGKVPVELDLIREAKTYVKEARRLVDDGTIGYCVIIADRP
ncbi:MAG: methyltransferase domain-containing protein [Chloroflexi bacterium]|nr:methyltransferase domain-containing protein [Chloroflexota bacterium]